MTAPTHSLSPSPSTSPKGVDQLARVAGKPLHENDYFSSSETNEKPGSESISEQPKNQSFQSFRVLRPLLLLVIPTIMRGTLGLCPAQSI